MISHVALGILFSCPMCRLPEYIYKLQFRSRLVNINFTGNTTTAKMKTYYMKQPRKYISRAWCSIRYRWFFIWQTEVWSMRCMKRVLVFAQRSQKFLRNEIKTIKFNNSNTSSNSSSWTTTYLRGALIYWDWLGFARWMAKNHEPQTNELERRKKRSSVQTAHIFYCILSIYPSHWIKSEAWRTFE